MNTPTDNRVLPIEKPSEDEMYQEVCDFAHALMRGGGSPLDVIRALLTGTIAFGGRIGEDAMRKYVGDLEQIHQNDEENRLRKSYQRNPKKHYDNCPF